MTECTKIKQLVCPCQSDANSPKSYQKCCQPLHLGLQVAETAERLMRSRYSAHALAATEPELVSYITETWASDSPMQVSGEEILAWCQSVSWQGLTVLSTDKGQRGDDQGTVDFCARFVDAQGQAQQHLEHSSFTRDNGLWKFYLGENFLLKDVGRNSPCPCGSGKKFKKCCG